MWYRGSKGSWMLYPNWGEFGSKMQKSLCPEQEMAQATMGTVGRRDLDAQQASPWHFTAVHISATLTVAGNSCSGLLHKGQSKRGKG